MSDSLVAEVRWLTNIFPRARVSHRRRGCRCMNVEQSNAYHTAPLLLFFPLPEPCALPTLMRCANCMSSFASFARSLVQARWVPTFHTLPRPTSSAKLPVYLQAPPSLFSLTVQLSVFSGLTMCRHSLSEDICVPSLQIARSWTSWCLFFCLSLPSQLSLACRLSHCNSMGCGQLIFTSCCKAGPSSPSVNLLFASGARAEPMGQGQELACCLLDSAWPRSHACQHNCS